MKKLVLFLGFLILAQVPATVASAQVQPRISGQSPSGDLGYWSANAIIGGFTAGIASRARGRSFVRGFWQGMVGGSVAYLGKRVTSEPFTGAGFLGRHVGALGASIVRSAAFGSGLLVDTLVVPLGPIRGYVATASGGATWRIDVEELAWLIYGMASERLRFAARESLSSGSFVFTADGGIRDDLDTTTGRAAPGIVSLRLTDRGLIDDDVLAHERVHINQFDFVKIVAGLPTEGWLGRSMGIPGGGFLRHLDFGIGEFPFTYALTGGWLDRSNQLFEIEAEYFEAR